MRILTKNLIKDKKRAVDKSLEGLGINWCHKKYLTDRLLPLGGNMATAFSSPDQIVQVAPGVDNAQPNLDLEQLEEVFEIERCQTWVNENGYSRWGHCISYDYVMAKCKLHV